MTSRIYPGADWQSATPAEVNMDGEKLNIARAWLDDKVQDGRYRVAVVRHGRLIAEWNHGVARDEQLRLASATKSIFSCMLGIAIDEGKIPSADAKIIDYYPEAMDVPPGQGPKEGRHVFEANREITFRHLISNTSGYMKPGEAPGQIFNYQTYGMNILTHAIAKSYGLYDIEDPEGSPGLKVLMDEKLRLPLAASWDYYLANFDLPPQARLNIFGYYEGVQTNALDMARLGWLWCKGGRWGERQLVPEGWLREATQTAPDIKANCPSEQWQYGYGFWTNSDLKLFPSLPQDLFMAWGAGKQYISVCPSLDLVVVQSPGLLARQDKKLGHLMQLVIDACLE